MTKSLLQRELDDSSSDDDDYLIFSAAQIVQTYSNAKGRHSGSVLGHQVIYRDREDSYQRIFQDYLADDPTYGPHLFRRRLVCIQIIMIGTYYVVNYYMSCLNLFLFISGTG